ncbi:MAG: ABC transporter ATP-binding protein [Alphaproteobacteria bacterium]|nr:ABC transporter ATP-binding protein [Alphaproteobacteria bacterium]
MSVTSLIELKSVSVSYDAVNAVRGIDLSIKDGEIVALLGANGAGKSSTLNAIVGLAPVSAGKIIFDGTDITDFSSETLAPLGLTLSPEGRRVFATLSVEDNLMLGAYSVKDKAQIKAAYERVYELFPILFERKQQYGGTLSGGQQQMLALGRALMCSPRLLLLDEPSLGLAPIIVEQIFELIALLRQQGVTIILVEQNVSMALNIADRGYVMASGKIVAHGDAASLSDSTTLENAYLGAE